MDLAPRNSLMDTLGQAARLLALVAPDGELPAVGVGQPRAVAQAGLLGGSDLGVRVPGGGRWPLSMVPGARRTTIWSSRH
jgi:hypothetical protein